MKNKSLKNSKNKKKITSLDMMRSIRKPVPPQTSADGSKKYKRIKTNWTAEQE